MIKTKVIFTNSEVITFQTDEKIDLSFINNETKQIVFHFKNKMIYINLQNVNSIETDK